jgi:predicted phosphodiesterase
MKLRILSDLHIHHKNDFPFQQLDEDVVVFAGDIAEGMQGCGWIKQQNITVPVIYVPGNHEYYGQDIGKLNVEFRKVKHCNILNNQVMEIDDVVFVGTVLWTDFNIFGNQPLHAEMTRRALNDYVWIQRKGHRFTIDAQIAYNKVAIRFLEKVIKNKDPKKTYVLVTHHCAEWSIANRFKTDPVTAGFATKLPYGMEQEFKLWIHGHTHDAFDYKIGDCQIVCNPRGYFHEGNAFNKDLIVEV